MLISPRAAWRHTRSRLRRHDGIAPAYPLLFVGLEINLKPWVVPGLLECMAHGIGQHASSMHVIVAVLVHVAMNGQGCHIITKKILPPIAIRGIEVGVLVIRDD